MNAMVEGAATVVKICMKSLIRNVRIEINIHGPPGGVITYVRYAEMNTTVQVRHPSRTSMTGASEGSMEGSY
jgi:hypothetical protein